MKSNLPTLSSNQVCDLLSLCLMLGAYLVFVVLGAVAVVNGIATAMTDPRMPTWMPSTPVGAVYAASGAVSILAASVRSRAIPQPVLIGKLALGVCAAQSMALATGLLHRFGTPNAITQSIDRPIMYIAYALVCLVIIREPPSNPVTSTD